MFRRRPWRACTRHPIARIQHQYDRCLRVLGKAVIEHGVRVRDGTGPDVPMEPSMPEDVAAVLAQLDDEQTDDEQDG